MGHTPGEWKPVPCEDGSWNVMHEAGLFYWTLHETEGNARLVADAPDLLAACEVVAARPAEAQAMMRREGFVIDDLDDRWQKFAFTLYTMLAENATQAQAVIDKVDGKAD